MYTDSEIASKIGTKEIEKEKIEKKKNKLEIEKKAMEKNINNLTASIKTLEENLEKEKNKKIREKGEALKKDREVGRNNGKASEMYKDNRGTYPIICEKYFQANMSESYLITVDKELATAIIENEIREPKEKLEREKEEKKRLIEEEKNLITEKKREIDEAESKITDIEEEITKPDNTAENKDIENIQKRVQAKLAEIEKYIDIPLAVLENLYIEMDGGINRDDVEKMVINFEPTTKEEKMIKNKIAVILMELACVNNLVTLGYNKVSKSQIEKSKLTLKEIGIKINQITAHQTVCNTIELLDKRVQNIEKLDTTNPKKLSAAPKKLEKS